MAIRGRWWALTVLCAGMSMITLDGTIVGIALPAIEADLGFTHADLTWTVNAYLVPLGGLLLVSGRLGDLYGRRRMLVAGFTVFVLASALCGAAGSAAMLVVARFVQGVGAAMASAVVLGMIVGLFPDPAARARAMGVYAFVGAAGASVGLVLGGVLAGTVGWRWIFLVNVPIGVVAIVLLLRVLAPDPARREQQRADLLGGVLVTAGLMLGVLAIVASTGGLARLGIGAGAIGLLAWFVIRQRRVAAPLVRLAIFSSRAVSAGNLVQLLTVAGMLGFQFLVALHLQGPLGLPPVLAGFAVLPISVLVALVSLLLAGRLIVAFGARPLLVGGLALLVPGLFLLTRGGTSYLVDVLPSMVLLGVGAGLVLPAVTTIIMSDASQEDAGLASGLANTSMQVGGAFGIAVVAAVAAAGTDGLVGGARAGFAVSAGLVAAALVLAVVALPRERQWGGRRAPS